METATTSQIKVITFDLDNTLWKTSAVISSANDVLHTHLTETLSLEIPTRVEKVMGDLFQANKVQYAPGVMDEKDIKGPTLLTQLRIDAVFSLLVQYNEMQEEEAQKVAQEAFEVWTQARHDAIPTHAVPNLLSTLNQLRSIQYKSDSSSTDSYPVVIGAITDGNSNPTTVPILRPYFDFVVNAERVGISKPDRRLYEAAVAEVSSLALLGDGNEKELMVEDGVGPWWVHIGDDFIKDVVAAKDLRMRTVWARELVKKTTADSVPVTTDNTSEEEEDEKPKKDVQELIKELSEKKVIEMYIGADDFLADSIERDFADAIVDEFRFVGDVVCAWHQEGLERSGGKRAEIQQNVKEMTNVVDSIDAISENDMAAIAEVLSVVVPDDLTNVEVEVEEERQRSPSPPPSMVNSPAISDANESKFCIHCGTKLPLVARFCSGCGEKQP
uniref:Zinc-ribbon domain-containing protein n=1 Tax=Ditylum brightwellii TaxID=49249 RepID=A0A6V2NPC6_9STRA|mmetsp:Transcript_16252/g.21811  ORF Transcript_16252/g.21811 Transcript_16252/m.21811 type:complete len:443 (+) Transcript_16252:1105-2433(+)